MHGETEKNITRQPRSRSQIPLPLPEPSAGIAAYEAELRARLDSNSRTFANYSVFMNTRRLRGEKVNYLPTKLDIENVSRCNFRCVMCAVSDWKKGKRAGDMCLDEFKRIIDENHGLVEIKLNGLGEALMQGDDYFEMIRYARARRIWVRMTTNASLLGVNGNAQKLVDSDVNEIDISIDGADARTFEAIRRGASYRHVIQNCYSLNQLTSRTKMWTLVQELNYRNLPAHVSLARQLGFKHLVFSTALHGWGDDELAKENAERSRGITLEQGRDLVDAGIALGVRVSFWNVAEKFDSDNLCPWPFERYVVTSDSRVTPCCMIGNPDKLEILGGWNGEGYQTFRKMHIDGKLPEPCKGCYKK